MTEYVVLLQAGSKQEFIFSSNKQAVNIGASELITRSGTTWVRAAIDAAADGRDTSGWTLLSISGKAVLRVPDEDTGRRIIRHVTTTALRAAPGLDVCGILQPIHGTLSNAVRQAHQEHRAVRLARPSLRLRHPTLPYSQPCQYSALPATGTGIEGTRWFPRAATIHAAWNRGGAGRDRMAGLLNDEDKKAVLGRELLARGVSNAGWVAVVHADGNGIGQVFSLLDAVTDDAEYRALYTGLSDVLDRVTQQALQSAVQQARRHNPRPGQAEVATDWILPIVVGGDDVTAIMDAQLAFTATCVFLREFRHHSQATDVRELLWRLWAAAGQGEQAPDSLTASAGIAFVKPHHPFSDAYRLAEELCASAKTVKNVDGTPHCALDFHVLHDSVSRPLAEIRAAQTTADVDGARLRRWAGPYLVGPDGGEVDDSREVAALVAAMDALRATDEPALLSVGALRRLHGALMRGGALIERERAQVLVWQNDQTEVAEYLDTHLRVTPPDVPGAPKLVNTPFTRIVDALHLLDMETGTAGEADVSQFDAARRA